VHAYADELDQWRLDRVVAPQPVREVAAPSPAVKQWPNRRRAGVLMGVSATLIALALWKVRLPSEIPPVLPTRIGRFLVRATSEDSRQLPRIQLDINPEFLALTPDGNRLYVASVMSDSLSVVRTADGNTRKLVLPKDKHGGPLAMSPDGRRLYVGFLTGGIAVVDVGSGFVRPVIPTPGPVFSLSLTSDGTKLFLAMGNKGVWRMLTATEELRQITSQQCPENLQVGGPESRLYVTYQCGEVRGRDLLEVFDSRTERRLNYLQGPPMVGGYLDVSSDGKWLLLDGLDACLGTYPHFRECPAMPARIYYLVRSEGLEVEKTLPMPALSSGQARFIDLERILMLGQAISVMKPSERSVSEKWEGASEGFDSLVVQGDHRKAYVGVSSRRQILTLTAAGSECAAPSEDLVAFYTGDGVTTDVVGGVDLTASGTVRFGLGRVGQSFVLDGKSGYLYASSTGHVRFGHLPSSMAAFLKFARVDGEMAILDRTISATAESARLTKAVDNRFHFDFGLKRVGAVQLASKTVVEAGRWYHVCVTRSEVEVSLYVDGVLEDNRPLDPTRTADAVQEDAPIYVGATGDHQAFLDGKLDELLFYGRALSPGDVRHIFQLGQAPDCRM
jgi:hypothetical protein